MRQVSSYKVINGLYPHIQQLVVEYCKYSINITVGFCMLHSSLKIAADLLQEQLLLRKGTVECKLLALAAHQFWGTWAILQAKYSPIDFDYMEYSKMRWDECFHREDEFLAQAETWLHQNKS